ncbi:MAG: glycoside hydrolase family 16 protein [Bacteroidales bacterium]|nr:glycoside hydrolase family 16 protein [Bacteroidales bacterium]
MKIIIFFIAFVSLCFSAFSQVVDVPLTPANDPHWELKWSDEFNVNAKTQAEWNTHYANNWRRKNYFDHFGEPQLFMDTNVFVEDSVLVLKLEKDSCRCPQAAVTEWGCKRQWEDSTYYYRYTNGWVETKLNAAKQYGRYGYIEAKINFPYHRKFWHAFWTLHMNDNDTMFLNNAEIDIAEQLGHIDPWATGNILVTNTQNYTTTNVWQCYDSINRARLGDFFQPIYVPNYSWESEWHKYAVEWSPTRLIWYVDDKPIRELRNHGIEDTITIIFGLGVQNTVGIETDTELVNLIYPQIMKVDYVRVYQLKKECEEIFEACNYDFSNYDNTVKKKIIIGDESCNNTISTDTILHAVTLSLPTISCNNTISTGTILRASESVEINENFTLEEGVELYIDVDGCTVDDVENIEQYNCNF